MRRINLQGKLQFMYNQIIHELFHDRDCYHIEISPLICSANQWTGFYIMMASVMKELKYSENIKNLVFQGHHVKKYHHICWLSKSNS